MLIFYHGNLKDCLMKVLSLLLHLIISLIIHVGTKARVEFKGDCLKYQKNFIWLWKSSKNLYCLWDK